MGVDEQSFRQRTAMEAPNLSGARLPRSNLRLVFHVEEQVLPMQRKEIDE